MKKLLLLLAVSASLFAQVGASLPQPAGSVGPRPLADGTMTGERFGRDGAQVVQEGHSSYQELILRGGTYQACNQAGVALTVALGTTATGFILTNPAGSGYNLVLIDLVVAVTTAPAGISTMLLAGNVNTAAAAVTHTTPLTVRNALLGQTRTGVGLADSAATLPAAPVVVRPIPGGPVATGTTQSQFIKDTEPPLVLSPGTSISTFALTTAISAVVCMTWEEVPI
jgi:hypothetical protein